MNNRPIHQNLDTSYVNLSTLVKYLTKRQFVGGIRVKLNGYTAEILINEKNRLKVRERDLISGRISEGAEAFKRLLIRAREPGGTIDVYQSLNSKTQEETAALPKSGPNPVAAGKINEDVRVAAPMVGIAEEGHANIPALNGMNGQFGNEFREIPSNGHRANPVAEPETPKDVTPERLTSLPDFPFELTNNVEQKAQNQDLSTKDWQILLKLTVEILGVVDRSLSTQELDFAAAFRKARAEIADDYPFMDPAEGIFDYENRRITMTTQVNKAVFIRSIVESLKRILIRLGGNPKFDILYRNTAHMIMALIDKRKQYYDRFGLTTPLRNILGI